MNKVLGSSTVVIHRHHSGSGRHQEKVVNIDLLKSEGVGNNVLSDPEDVEDVEAEGVADAKDKPIPDHEYSLLDRSSIHHPAQQNVDVIRRRVKENDL